MEPHKVMIHLRFAPNGTVVEISERPKSLTPQEWFNFLSDKAGNAYQALSGGPWRVSADSGRGRGVQGRVPADRGMTIAATVI